MNALHDQKQLRADMNTLKLHKVMLAVELKRLVEKAAYASESDEQGSMALLHEKATMQLQLDKLAAENTQLTEDRNRLIGELDRSKMLLATELERLNGALNAAVTEKEQLRSVSLDQQRQLEDVVPNHAQTGEMTQKLRDEIDQLRRALDEKTGAHGVLQNRFNDIEKQLAVADHQAEGLSTEQKEANERLRSAAQDKQALTALQQISEAALVEKDRQLADLQTQLDDLNIQHQNFLATSDLAAKALPEAATEVRACESKPAKLIF